MSIKTGTQMKHAIDDCNYQAFLLRCWQESPSGGEMESTWRFSLIHINGIQTKKGFASLEHLLDYLRAELGK